LVGRHHGRVLVLLDTLPHADVIVLDHEGVDSFRPIGDMVHVVRVAEALRVLANRISRADVPPARAEHVGWLDQLWIDLDHQITARSTKSD
jgi:hypothetical protein